MEVENAQEELITMDAMRAPQDKLQCVVACSKSIFRILTKSSDDVCSCPEHVHGASPCAPYA